MKKIFVIIVCLIALMAAVSCAKKEGKRTADAEQLFEKGDKPIDAYIFFVNPEKEAFKLYKATIYESDIPENRIKQALNILFSKPPEGFLPTVPEGSEIKNIYMDQNGTCYVNLSDKFRSGLPGGTTYEYYALYSVINTIMRNFKSVNGVRVLVEGEETDTLGGHIKASGILRP